MLALAALVGVPLMVPSLLRLRPAGRVPLARLQVSGAVPPVEVSVWL